MSWAVGYDENWQRDIGYGVPATCDHPGCNAKIDRGLSFVCGHMPYGGEEGCGLFFCSDHRDYAEGYEHQVCERCAANAQPFQPTPDVPEWVNHKLTDESWQRWRDKNPTEVAKLKADRPSPAPKDGSSKSGGA